MPKRWKVTILILIIIPLALIGFTAGYFLNKIWQVSKIITVEDSGESEYKAVSTNDATLSNAGDNTKADNMNENADQERGFHVLDFLSEQKLPERGTKERINILLLGKAVPNYPGADLTDTIMLASINPATYQSSLLSIPRDLYVQIPDTNQYTKINAVYVYGLKQGGPQRGIDLLKNVITNITGQKVDYYAMVNFTAFENVIDTLSGVDVNVENNILDNRYPGPNFSYQTFQIDKGWHHLDGATALKYVRVRHTTGGDFGRAKRQQQVIEAAKEKFFQKRSIGESLDFFNQMLKIVENNVKTDIPFSDYLPFLLLAKDVNVHQVVNKVLDNSPEGLLEDYNPVIGQVTAYTLRPRAGNYYQIRELAGNIFNLDKIARQNQARAQENPKVLVLAAPDYSGFVSKVQSLLRSEGYQIVTEDITADPVFLWQRKSGARLPTVSSQNRGTLSSETLVDKTELPAGSLKQTVVYDNAEGSKPFSLEDLSGHLNARVSLFKETRTSADFVVIVGGNASELFQKDNGQFFLTDQGMEQEKADSE